MAEAFDDTNRGVLFREEDKKNERGPDYTGSVNVHGETFRLAGWVRESKAGRKFLSLAVSEPRDAVPAGPTSNDDSIPF